VQACSYSPSPGVETAELLGLRWADLDLAADRLEVLYLQRVDGRLALVRPKTSASRRPCSWSSATPPRGEVRGGQQRKG
jgi:hypothetical protein